MNDTKGHDWSKDWQALQCQYWTAWSDLTRNQAGAETPDPATPWHEGLEMWSRMFGKASKQSEAAERLMASAKDYLGLMQSMLEFASGKNTGALGVQSWLDTLRNGFNMPGLSMQGVNMSGVDAALLNNPVGKALREIAGQGLKSFEQLASGATPMFEQWQKDGRSWLQVPAFGYAREHQEHYQKMALAFVDFQEAVGRYNALILKSSQRSFEILEGKLAERDEPGRQVDTVRALYDLWVDAAEEAYAEIALSDEFRTVYGEVVNSQMRVRSQLQQEVERIGVDLGMPTRTELNSVHKRMHDLRRELRANQEALRNGAADGRDGEIAAMRAEIDELRRLLENSEPAAPRTATARPAATPKPAARRKRRTPRSKRAAAKRTHVATKSTPAVAPPPPAEEPIVEAVPAPPVKAKAKAPVAPKAAKQQRAARRSKAERRAAARPEKALAETEAPLSFGAAIAAMRREVARGKKKSKGARTSIFAKLSKPVESKRRSKP